MKTTLSYQTMLDDIIAHPYPKQLEPLLSKYNRRQLSNYYKRKHFTRSKTPNTCTFVFTKGVVALLREVHRQLPKA